MNLVDRNVQILDGQAQQLRNRQAEIAQETERLQQQRQKLAYPAKVGRNPAAIDRLAEVEAKIRELNGEDEVCTFALDEIAARRKAEEARRPDIEELENELVTRERARLDLAKQIDKHVADLALLVSEYTQAGRTCGGLASRLEKPDAAKYNHQPFRLYRLIYGHLNEYMSQHMMRPGGGGLRCSLAELEGGKDITLIRPELEEAGANG